MIHFPGRTPFQNYLTGRQKFLCRADIVLKEASSIEQIVHICNQPLIYQILFQARFNGKPYTQDDARQFLTWARQGWSESSHFVFLMMTENGDIAGAMDIKSADLEAAEIGYWASADHSGNTTNAVLALMRAASAAGFRRFIAYVRKSNEKSQRVLLRAGFSVAEALPEREGFQGYACRLDAPERADMV